MSNQYVIDTNILISFRIFTPMNIHKTFWNRMTDAVKQGKLIFIQDVAEECKDPFLKLWLKTVSNSVTRIDDNLRNRAIEINNQYPMIDRTSTTIKSQADPVIIAFAEKNKDIVFSHEKNRKKDDDLYKIPDVCEILKIRCVRWPDKVLPKIIKSI